MAADIKQRQLCGLEHCLTKAGVFTAERHQHGNLDGRARRFGRGGCCGQLLVLRHQHLTLVGGLPRHVGQFGGVIGDNRAAAARRAIGAGAATGRQGQQGRDDDDKGEKLHPAGHFFSILGKNMKGVP